MICFQDIYDFFLLLPEVATNSTFDTHQWASLGADCSDPIPQPADAIFPLPSARTSYQTHYSSSVLELGYTLSYTEYFDATRNLLRSDNRYTGIGTVEIDDFNANVSTVYHNDGSSMECFRVPMSPDQRARNLPSSILFTENESLFEARNYVGRAADSTSRYLLTDRWESSYGVAWADGSFSNFTAIFMSSVAQPGLASEPVRIQVNGVSYRKDTNGEVIPGSTQVFFHVYDYTNFLMGVPDASLFTVPTSIAPHCMNVPALPGSLNFTLPTSYTLPHPISFPPYPDAPELSKSFAALVEAKVSSTSEHGILVNEVYTIEWNLDRNNNREVVQRIAPNKWVNSSTQIILYDSYPGKGSVYTVLNDGTCTLDKFNKVVPSGPAPIVSTPGTLWNLFSGALLTALLIDPQVPFLVPPIPANPGFLAFQLNSDLGIENDRGIVCDKFKAARGDVTGASDQMGYTSQYWTADPSWTYVGSTSQQRPVRVMVSGLQAGVPNAPGRGFDAVLDLFHYSQRRHGGM
jgi:hypothetical protein